VQDLIDELKKHVPFKEETAPGDIVLIAGENPRMVVYGLIASIERDKTKRDPWWHLTMHVLSVPPQRVTWTLREPQFTGREIFTMGGEARFIQAVRLDHDGSEPPERKEIEPSGPGPGIRRIK